MNSLPKPATAPVFDLLLDSGTIIKKHQEEATAQATAQAASQAAMQAQISQLPPVASPIPSEIEGDVMIESVCLF